MREVRHQAALEARAGQPVHEPHRARRRQQHLARLRPGGVVPVPAADANIAEAPALGLEDGERAAAGRRLTCGAEPVAAAKSSGAATPDHHVHVAVPGGPDVVEAGELRGAAPR